MSRQFKDPRTLFQSGIETAENRPMGVVRSLSIADFAVIVVIIIWLLLALVAGFAVLYQ